MNYLGFLLMGLAIGLIVLAIGVWLVRVLFVGLRRILTSTKKPDTLATGKGGNRDGFQSNNQS